MSEFNYIWDTIRILIAVFAGWLISRLNELRKERKATKAFNNKFLRLFEAFKARDIIKILRLVKAIGMKDIETIFNAVGAIWYDPTRKSISETRNGRSTEREPFKNEKEDFDMDRFLTLKKESIKTESESKEEIKTETYVVVENLQNLRVRIDLENWMVFLGYGGMSSIFDNKTRKHFYFKDPEKSSEILSDFLTYLQKRYKEEKLIKEKENLLK